MIENSNDHTSKVFIRCIRIYFSTKVEGILYRYFLNKLVMSREHEQNKQMQNKYKFMFWRFAKHLQEIGEDDTHIEGLSHLYSTIFIPNSLWQFLKNDPAQVKIKNHFRDQNLIFIPRIVKQVAVLKLLSPKKNILVGSQLQIANINEYSRTVLLSRQNGFQRLSRLCYTKVMSKVELFLNNKKKQKTKFLIDAP